jgi:hypothetical protein
MERDGFILYRGYRAYLSRLSDVDNLGATARALKRQIDITESVGLDDSVLQFLRGIEIKIIPSHPDSGHYSGEVIIGSIQPTDDRPVLLHEFMHAFHERVLPSGFANPQILEFYERAKSENLYRRDAYVLSSVAEFFAITATVFLCGRVARPPFTREQLRLRQPTYFGYLHHLLQAESG